MSQGLVAIPVLPRLFVQRNADQSIRLAMVKVVDGMLITGSQEDIAEFHNNIS